MESPPSRKKSSSIPTVPQSRTRSKASQILRCISFSGALYSALYSETPGACSAVLSSFPFTFFGSSSSLLRKRGII